MLVRENGSYKIGRKRCSFESRLHTWWCVIQSNKSKRFEFVGLTGNLDSETKAGLSALVEVQEQQ